MLRVLGKPSSINVRKVLWCCAELGLEVEPEPWGSGHRPTDIPEFLALNPNGLVPVLVEGRHDVPFVLWESNSICRYLAAREGSGLLPTEPRSRALVEQWMDWQATSLNTAWRYAFMARVRHSPAHADPAALDASVTEWNRHMAMLDAQLHKTGAHVVGDPFTLADIVLGLSTHRWLMTPMKHDDLPAVRAYYERLSERPAFRVHGRNGIP